MYSLALQCSSCWMSAGQKASRLCVDVCERACCSSLQAQKCSLNIIHLDENPQQESDSFIVFVFSYDSAPSFILIHLSFRMNLTFNPGTANCSIKKERI